MKSSITQLVTSWICILALANIAAIAQQIQQEASTEDSRNPIVPGNQIPERGSLHERVKQGRRRNPEIKAIAALEPRVGVRLRP